MDRREFFKKALQAGAAAGAAALLSKTNILFGEDQPAGVLEMVAVRGGEPDAMFDTGMKALGGMANFIKKDQTVLVKPNIGWAREPEFAATTNPMLVSQIIKHCLEAGAKKVIVFDNTCDNWEICYKKSGIEAAAREAGADVVPGNSSKYYQDIKIPGAKTLSSAKVNEVFLESDAFINVPILKSHSSTRITAGMKNLMGVVWNRDYWHGSNLDQCIADFAKFRKPVLTVVDAYAIMKTNGPRGMSKSDLEIKKNLLISTDIVLADAAAAKIFGSDPSKITHIKRANDQGVGNMETEGRNIQKIVL